jgi:hypothetical protein
MDELPAKVEVVICCMCTHATTYDFSYDWQPDFVGADELSVRACVTERSKPQYNNLLQVSNALTNRQLL